MSSILAALAVLAAIAVVPARASAGEPVLYVGDSLGVGTVQQLRSSTAPGALEFDAKVGRGSTEGLAVLGSRLQRKHKIVVFDLGTNDATAELLGANLRRARALTGERLLIVFTLNKAGADPFNRVIRAFAGSADNVFLVDWHSTAARRHLLAGDGIHASPSGYRRRAALVNALIRGVSQARWAAAP
jgi:lysophospholipase L1-like esterase